ncbi:sugar ABC transporter ATP-binding protein [Sodalis sp. RH22]|uniref:sugar ABC transporter ATP-binding protein n=1 Tax=unclassified Sodalis (in: enterobacteria) TaxID=2636512 RepID=UPI0039B5EDB0
MIFDTVIELRDIEKSFGSNQVLKKICFSARAGEVHALIGENGAGKSTLMKIICGIYPPSSGDIYFNGNKITPTNSLDAQNIGIGVVHQELSLIPELTVAQNIYGNRAPANRLGFINWKKLNQQTQALFIQLGINLRADIQVKKLTVGMQQLVEIAKAISLNAKVLIMDEPSSSLSEQDVDILYRVVRDLKKKGVAMIFISHKLDEIFAIAERCSVLRDGNLVSTSDTSKTNKARIISEMVGRELTQLYPPKGSCFGDVIFKCEKLERTSVFSDVSFDIRRGEILGCAGLVGAGRTEIARAIFGADKLTSGTLTLDGKKLVIHQPSDAINAGIVYLTEDRKHLGLFLEKNIVENIVSSTLDNYTNVCGLIFRRRMQETAQKYITGLQIRTSSIEQLVGNLSGGNQQKVLLAKCLEVKPKLLIVDEPTRGVDVGAKSAIHGYLRKLANEGVAVLVISSELPEVVGLSDRIAIFREGRLEKIVTDESTQEQIMQYAAV